MESLAAGFSGALKGEWVVLGEARQKKKSGVVLALLTGILIGFQSTATTAATEQWMNPHQVAGVTPASYLAMQAAWLTAMNFAANLIFAGFMRLAEGRARETVVASRDARATMAWAHTYRLITGAGSWVLVTIGLLASAFEAGGSSGVVSSLASLSSVYVAGFLLVVGKDHILRCTKALAVIVVIIGLMVIAFGGGEFHLAPSLGFGFAGGVLGAAKTHAQVCLDELGVRPSHRMAVYSGAALVIFGGAAVALHASGIEYPKYSPAGMGVVAALAVIAPLVQAGNQTALDRVPVCDKGRVTMLLLVGGPTSALLSAVLLEQRPPSFALVGMTVCTVGALASAQLGVMSKKRKKAA
jgi:hypothetical protein